MCPVYSHNLDELPEGAFIPTYLENWAVISKFMPDVPAVELDLTASGGLKGQILCLHSEDQNPSSDEFYPEAIEVLQDGGSKICLIDQRIHGWDAIQCDLKPEGPRVSSRWKCRGCGDIEFVARFSWLGYQVFDEGWENSGPDLLKFRDSFDSAAIDVTCLSCKLTQECLFEAELA